MDKIKLYDKLLKLMHKYKRYSYINMLLDCKIFTFDEHIIESLKDETSKVPIELLKDEKLLNDWHKPFDNMVIHLKLKYYEHIAVIIDIPAFGSKGFYTKRWFLIYSQDERTPSMSSMSTGTISLPDVDKFWNRGDMDVIRYVRDHCVEFTTISIFENYNQLVSTNEYKEFKSEYDASHDHITITNGVKCGRIDYHELIQTEVLTYIMYSLLKVTSSKREFILETRPIRKYKHKLLKSDQQSQFILLPVKEIRRRMNLPTPEHKGGTKRPHPRRRHPRTLRSSKYGKRQGETIWIPANWIGPSESKDNKRIYKVRLDL